MNLQGTRIAGRYEVKDLLAEGGMSFVYRGFELDSHKPVAVKVLKSSMVSSRLEDFVRFQGVLDAISRLDHPHIVRVREIGSLDIRYGIRSWYIIMDLSDGANLYEAIRSRRLSIDESCSLILQACLGLETVHRLGIIHADIKPGNMLIEHMADTPILKLIDFGLSHIKRMDDAERSENTSGTFAYMSPEQTGILRKTIDERSDLYSLGVVWYELLTGVLPFRGDSIIRLLYDQAAKVPDPPSLKNVAVPPVLDAMVMKLLEKDPKRRYQSVAGLMKDLEHFLAGNREFIPGAGDTAVLMGFVPPMIGRDTEMHSLEHLLDEVLDGRGRICFITGEAGIGKSRLADEFRTRVISRGVPWIEGRAFDRKNKTPHGPIRDAINEYLSLFRIYSAKRRGVISNFVKKKCGSLARVVTEFHPPAAEILGQGPETVPLEQEREIERFYMTLNRFFFSLAVTAKGLVLMLDDLHWSDRGTLRLLEDMLPDINDVPLLIVCAFRDAELDADHPLRKMIQFHGDVVDTICMGDLSRGDLSGMLKSIAVNEDDAEVLSEFIITIGGSNPLFLNEIIRRLFEKKVILSDGSKLSVDLSRLSGLDMPPTVIDSFMRHMKKLSAEEAGMLSRASVIGKVFDAEKLLAVDEHAGDDRDTRIRNLLRIIDRAIALNLLTTATGGNVSFVHDRIRDAFLSMLAHDERRRLHRLIGKYLVESHPAESENVFDLAYHFIEAGDEQMILRFAFPAAFRARREYSHAEAIRYFTIIRELTGGKKEKMGTPLYKTWIESIRELGETYLHIGKTEEALALFQELLTVIKTGHDRANIFLFITKAYFKKADFPMVESTAKEGLALFGEKVPEKKTVVLISLLKETCIRLVYSFIPFSIKPDDSKEIERHRLVVDYYNYLYWAYYFGDMIKLKWVSIRMLNISERMIGLSRELAISIMYYGMMLVITKIGENKLSNKYFSRVIEIFSGLSNEIGAGLIYAARSFYNCAKCEIDLAYESVKIANRIFEETGDCFEMARSYRMSFTYLYLLSNYDEAYRYYTLCKKLSTKFYLGGMRFFIFGYPSEYYVEIGEYKRAEDELLRFYEITREKGPPYYRCLICIYTGHLYMEKGNIEKAFLYMNEARQLIESNTFPPYYISIFYPYYSLLLIQQFRINQGLLSAQELIKARRKIHMECRRALKKTKVKMLDHPMCLRAMALYHTLTHDNNKACIYFERSIRFAESIGRRYEQARSLYEYGVYLRQSGDWNGAWNRLTSAYLLFEEIGVPVFRNRIAEHLGMSVENDKAAEGPASNEKLRYLLEKSNEFSSCADLDDLLGRVLTLAMELSGARNGQIFLFDEEEKRLKLAVEQHEQSLVPGECSMHIVNEAFENGRIVLLYDAAVDERYSESRSVSVPRLKSVMCLPLRHKDLVTGVCFLGNALVDGIFTENTERLLAMLLSNAVILTENFLYRERLKKSETATSRKITEHEQKYIHLAYKFIHKNLSEELTREHIADDLGLSPNYFGKIFKSASGKSVREYINEMRIIKSRELIDTTDRHIVDIAMEVGFESVRTFYRCFYRICGMTASEYRDKHNRV